MTLSSTHDPRNFPPVSPLPFCPRPGLTGALGDLYSFDPATMVWMLLPAAGNRPSNRANHGFTSAGGRLYVYGGDVRTIDNDYEQYEVGKFRGIVFKLYFIEWMRPQ
jgi:hypothetical protein